MSDNFVEGENIFQPLINQKKRHTKHKRRISDCNTDVDDDFNISDIVKPISRKAHLCDDSDGDFENSIKKPAKKDKKSDGKHKKKHGELKASLNSLQHSNNNKQICEKQEIGQEFDEDNDDFLNPKAKSEKNKASKSGKTKIKKEDLDQTKISISKSTKRNKSSETFIKEEIKEENEEILKSQSTKSSNGVKRKTKIKEEQVDMWKWWEETPHPQGVQWLTLEHPGPYFSPPYESLPNDVRFYYDGKPVDLCSADEEIASFYAKMLDSDYTQKEIFNNNFFTDWREVMCKKDKSIVKDFKKCDFKQMDEYYKKLRERLASSKEEKLALKEKNNEIMKKYGFCTIDGHVQKIANYKIEPPGLFRGRGDHPKQGKIKKRIEPENVIINISKDAKVPDPPEGHQWRGVVHDNKVCWLANWIENIAGSFKYVLLNPTTKIKGCKDMAKFDVARGLRNYIDKIRYNYRSDMSSDKIVIRQRAVALYFIDKLALRAGHEKEDGESADTVGCCSLRVQHIQLHKDYEKKQYVVDFDFLGKDSIRYVNSVSIEKKVFKNLQLFIKDKKPEDDLFDKLSSNSLNKYLSDLMSGLTAKVFRTYNASSTLQDQLEKQTNPDSSVEERILAYNRSNRAVAILCNHQRAIPKSFDKSMETLNERIEKKKKAIDEAKAELDELSDSADNIKLSLKQRKLERLKEHLHKLELLLTDREENKQIALGTSKVNYLDPRITVAWCKKFGVPVEKIYNKTQREKFQWAIDMTDSNFRF